MDRAFFCPIVRVVPAAGAEEGATEGAAGDGAYVYQRGRMTMPGECRNCYKIVRRAEESHLFIDPMSASSSCWAASVAARLSRI